MATDNNETNKNSEQSPDKAEKDDEVRGNQQETQKNQDQSSDVGNEKAMAIISYIFILWIVPLVAAQDSDFAMYHANQGLNLFIAAMVISAIGLIPILGWIIAPFGWIAVIIFMILGIANAASGKKKELPIIGSYRLLE